VIVSSVAINMAPPKPLANTEAEAKAQGNTTLFDCWHRSRAGRPKKSGNLASDKTVVKANDTKKKKKKPGPVPKPKSAPRQKTTANEDGILAQEQCAQKPMQKRTNWSKGERLLKMTSAMKNWEDKTGKALDSNGKKLRLAVCSDVVGTPCHTFKKFVTAKQETPREVGKSLGKAPLLAKEDQLFLAELFVRKDRANDGAQPKEAIDMVQDLDTSLTRLQATHHLQRTLIPNFVPLLKQKPVKAQAATTKQSGVTVVQQCRWHAACEGALNELRRLNAGSCKLTEKLFGELIHCFVTGSDETCLMVSDDGTVRIIGSVGAGRNMKPRVPIPACLC
jgi:hypothetical protein